MHGAKVFAKRAKRAKRTAKAEQGGGSSKEERSPPKAASSGRTTLIRSESKLERTGVVHTFLTDRCELSTSDSRAYAEALAAKGFDSIGTLAMIEDGGWPPIVLSGHRIRVKAEAQSVVAEKSAQKAAAKQASPCPCL